MFIIEKLTKKSILLIAVIMIALVLLYLIFSGFFDTYASHKDVLATSSYEKIAEGDDWSVYAHEKDEMVCCLAYEGEKHPKSNIHTKLIPYVEEDGVVTELQKEWFPGRDKHFFVVEGRYYFPEEFSDVTGIACHILWSEYQGGEQHSSYLFSEDLTEEQQDAARKYIDEIDLEDSLPTY